MTFLYLVPTGMNDPDRPAWGSWAGRYGPNEKFPGRPYFWANQADAWNGTTSRDNALARWATHLQNDFRARLDWCVKDASAANHPPVVRIAGDRFRSAGAGAQVRLDASASTDPDGDRLRFEWAVYPEAGTYRGGPIVLEGAATPTVRFTAPGPAASGEIHLVLSVTDEGSPPLTRYGRVVVKLGEGR